MNWGVGWDEVRWGGAGWSGWGVRWDRGWGKRCWGVAAIGMAPELSEIPEFEEPHASRKTDH